MSAQQISLSDGSVGALFDGATIRGVSAEASEYGRNMPGRADVNRRT